MIFHYLLKGQHGEFAGDGHGDGGGDGHDTPHSDAPHSHAVPASTGWRAAAMRPFSFVHRTFEAAFRRFAEGYRDVVAWTVAAPATTAIFFGALVIASLSLFPILGRDFFPQVDAGQMRLHVRAPAGSRIETTAQYFARVEKDVRRIVGNDQIDNVLSNIGLPYSGMNMAVGDTATVGTMDGEMLISLKENHTPTAAHVAALRRQLPLDFPDCEFFFQAADIVNQVLNFGQPAPIDVRVVGSDPAKTFALATKIAHDLSGVPGVVDSHVYQVPAVPGLRMRLDRGLAEQVDVSQRGAASSLLVTLNSSQQVGPNFWVNPKTGVSYPLVAQTPTYTINSLQDLRTMPLKTAGPPGAHDQGQLLMNVADIQRVQTPALISQSNVRPVFDVDANVQGRDLYGVAGGVRQVLARDQPPASEPITVHLTGQIDTMTTSYNGLFMGMGLAVVLVFLLMVIKFQSWLSPLIVLLAVPFALSGVCWGLFLTHTYMSVPALMGGLMCIGLATANSIPGGLLRRRAAGGGVHPRPSRRRRRLHAPAAGHHDGRRDDPGHAPDVARAGRRRRAERPAGPGRHRRADLRHLRDAGLRPDDVRPLAPPARVRRLVGPASTDPAGSRHRPGLNSERSSAECTCESQPHLSRNSRQRPARWRPTWPRRRRIRPHLDRSGSPHRPHPGVRRRRARPAAGDRVRRRLRGPPPVRNHHRAPGL